MSLLGGPSRLVMFKQWICFIATPFINLKGTCTMDTGPHLVSYWDGFWNAQPSNSDQVGRQQFEVLLSGTAGQTYE